MPLVAAVVSRTGVAAVDDDVVVGQRVENGVDVSTVIQLFRRFRRQNFDGLTTFERLLCLLPFRIATATTDVIKLFRLCRRHSFNDKISWSVCSCHVLASLMFASKAGSYKCGAL